MDTTTLIRVVAGVLSVAIVSLIIYRRKQKSA
jgi:LPXTG-motif cell wall-anchored protein